MNLFQKKYRWHGQSRSDEEEQVKNTSGRNQKAATLLLCTALFCSVQRLNRSDEDLVDKIWRRQDFITEEQVMWN